MPKTKTKDETPTFDLSKVPEHDRARVESMIPDPRIAQGYVHRSPLPGVEDFALLDIACRERENVLLAGPTGSSKTTVFRAYAAARRMPFALVECNGAMDPGVVLGRTVINPHTGQPEWVDGDMTVVIRYGGVLLLDEISMAHPRITAAFHQLLAVTRRISIPEAGETIAAGRGGAEPQPLLIGAAHNPRYQGTARMNEALLNRFAVQIDWDYSHDVESQLVASERLLEWAEGVRALGEIRTPLSTNALMEFERHADLLGFDAACTLLVNRFAPEERPAVGRALEAHSHAIAADLGFELGGAQ